MQFEYIELTGEQRNKLIERKIKNPYGSYLDITEGISPIYLTVDKYSLTEAFKVFAAQDCEDVTVQVILNI